MCKMPEQETEHTAYLYELCETEMKTHELTVISVRLCATDSVHKHVCLLLLSSLLWPFAGFTNTIPFLIVVRSFGLTILFGTSFFVAPFSVAGSVIDPLVCVSACNTVCTVNRDLLFHS